MLIVVILLSIITPFVACLFLPVEMSFRLEFDEGVRLRLVFSWAYGLLKRELEWESGAGVAGRLLHSGDRLQDIRRLLGGIPIKGLGKQFFRLAKGCFRCLKMEEFIARLKMGLDSPADTGLLFAYLSPLALLGLFPRCRIDLEPSFSGDALIQGYLSARVKTEPARLIIPVAGFVLSPPAIRAWARLVQDRWNGK